MTCPISQEELLIAVDKTFSSMAGMKLIADPGNFRPHPCGPYIVSAVRIAGGWQGAVRLDIELELAREICSRFLGVDPAQLSADDIRDSAGELANITGGSLKTLLAPACSLSLPSVVMGGDDGLSNFYGTVMQELSFVHRSGRMRVRVIAKQGCNGGASCGPCPAL